MPYSGEFFGQTAHGLPPLFSQLSNVAPYYLISACHNRNSSEVFDNTQRVPQDRINTLYIDNMWCVKGNTMRDTRPLAKRCDVADHLGVPEKTLTQWAHKGTGPRYIRVGRHARYRWSDVEKWEDQNVQGAA